MAFVEVRDHCLWIKHIHGDTRAVEALSALQPDALIELEIDGRRGMWARMKNDPKGRPTEGLRPIGPTQVWWRTYWEENRGELKPFRFAA
jgi:hypothetical protein